MEVDYGPDRDRQQLYVRARGRLDHMTTPYVWEALDDALGLDWPEVVLDLRWVTALDEDAVGMIAHAREVAHGKGVRFKLVDGPLETTARLKAAPVHRHLDLVQPQGDPYGAG